MANKRYYWLKLKEDFFASKEMKKLRKVAGGDTFVIIYLKMQLLSLKDEGKLYFEGIDDDFVSELALVLDEDVENVRMTLNFLEHCGLIEIISDNEYFLSQMPELIGTETQSTIRSRKSRALHCNANATIEQQNSNKNATTEIEKEIDIEKDKEIEKRERVDYQQIADMYNDICMSFPKCTSLSDSRKKAIKARLKTYTAEDLKRVFEKAEKSSFLKGKNNRNWSANFDWLIKDANMAKVLDGNYDDKEDNYGNGSESDKPVITEYNAAIYEGLV